ncbi:hypothetical protein P9112_003423 [Eukaryota sp. TZLM1-RC]
MRLFFVILLLVALASADLKCSACMKTVDSIVPSNTRTVTLATFYLHRVCEKLPEKYKEKCESWVANNEPKLLEWIHEGTIANRLCEQLKVCRAEPCENCLDAAKSIKKLIPKDIKNVNLDNFEPVLLKLCEKYSQMTGISKSDCAHFIKGLVGEGKKLLSSDRFEQIACEDLGLCPKNE